MDDTIAFTGGARIGWVQATWPFGQLSISPGQLTISLAFAGRSTFAPSEVSGLERGGIASNEVRIVHTRADVPQPIIFRYGGGVPRVLEAATRAGFNAVPSPPRPRGMPFRWTAIAQVLVACSVLLLL